VVFALWNGEERDLGSDVRAAPSPAGKLVANVNLDDRAQRRGADPNDFRFRGLQKTTAAENGNRCISGIPSARNFPRSCAKRTIGLRIRKTWM
jgi:hypothetical protein